MFSAGGVYIQLAAWLSANIPAKGAAVSKQNRLEKAADI